MESGDTTPLRRVVLVGFMGSGKSTVGRILGDVLGWSFLDVDELVAREAGSSISEIFAVHGEPFFRDLEHRITERALAESDAVLACGGGWPARPGRLESLGRGTVSVYLNVSFNELMRRLRVEPRGRPLLDGRDERALQALLDGRERFYRKATVTIDGEGPPGEVARRVATSLFEPSEFTEPTPPTHDAKP